MSDDTDIAAVLLAGLASQDGDAAEIAGFLQHPLTLIEAVPTPFLDRYGVFRVMPRHLSHPILRHVAGGEGLSTHILGADPATLAGVLRDDGSTLEDADEAMSYAGVLLEVVSPRPGLLRVIGSFDEIPFKEDLDDEETGAMAAAESSLAGRLRPPEAERVGDGWDVHLWVARGRAVERDLLRLDRDGDFLGHDIEESHDLPLILVA